MITVLRKVFFDTWIHEVYLLEEDTKPTNGIKNGSQLIEMDTAKLYFFDEKNKVWREFV